jgi:hypothetical protein
LLNNALEVGAPQSVGACGGATLSAVAYSAACAAAGETLPASLSRRVTAPQPVTADFGDSRFARARTISTREHCYEGAASADHDKQAQAVSQPTCSPPRSAKGNGVATVARRFSNGVTVAAPFESAEKESQQVRHPVARLGPGREHLTPVLDFDLELVALDDTVLRSSVFRIVCGSRGRARLKTGPRSCQCGPRRSAGCRSAWKTRAGASAARTRIHGWP